MPVRAGPAVDEELRFVEQREVVRRPPLCSRTFPLPQKAPPFGLRQDSAGERSSSALVKSSRTSAAGETEGHRWSSRFLNSSSRRARVEPGLVRLETAGALSFCRASPIKRDRKARRPALYGAGRAGWTPEIVQLFRLQYTGDAGPHPTSRGPGVGDAGVRRQERRHPRVALEPAHLQGVLRTARRGPGRPRWTAPPPPPRARAAPARCSAGRRGWARAPGRRRGPAPDGCRGGTRPGVVRRPSSRCPGRPVRTAAAPGGRG